MSDQHRISRAAQKAKPKQPLNAYFTFTTEFKKNLHEDDKHKHSRANIAYNDLSQREKDKLKMEYQKRLNKWRDDIAAWKKQYNIVDKSKAKSKNRQQRSKSKNKSKSKPKDKKK